MTVAENISPGREAINRAKVSRNAQKMSDPFHPDIEADNEIAELRIAKAISFNCRLLVMDEPTSSPSDCEVEQLFDILHDPAARGVGIVYGMPHNSATHQAAPFPPSLSCGIAQTPVPSMEEDGSFFRPTARTPFLLLYKVHSSFRSSSTT